jgi:uncharacterized protein with HEPN domain
MSDATPGREWRFYLDDMIGFCERVQAFTSGLDQSRFVSDVMCFDATVRNIELIGESATRIPEQVRLSSSSIPWRMIIATRNQLIHGYLGIDNDTLWSIVETDIPALLVNLRDLKAKLSEAHRSDE